MLYNRLNFLTDKYWKQFNFPRSSTFCSKDKADSSRSNEIYASQLLSRYGNVATLSKTCRQQKNQQHFKKVEKKDRIPRKSQKWRKEHTFLFLPFLCSFLVDCVEESMHTLDPILLDCLIKKVINLKRRHFHIFYNMKSTMISPHLRKGCFQRLWNVEIKLCTNMPTVPASSTKAPLDLCSALALQREQGLCRVRSATEELSAFLFQTVPVKTGSTVILLLACLSLQDMLCQISVDLVPGSVRCHQSDTKIFVPRYCYLWMIANYPIV